jgi:hypothetical protein
MRKAGAVKFFLNFFEKNVSVKFFPDFFPADHLDVQKYFKIFFSGGIFFELEKFFVNLPEKFSDLRTEIFKNFKIGQPASKKLTSAFFHITRVFSFLSRICDDDKE